MSQKNKTIAQKILETHLVSGKYVEGREIGIKIDQTLTQDALGTMAYLQFEALGKSRLKTDLSVSYVDHNTLQIGPENSDDHAYLKSIAAKYGIIYSPAGNGICHQVHVERFAVPGKTLLGSDSHTCMSGAIGMIAIGAGGLDVAVAMGGGPFFLTCPKVIKIELEGKLKSWVSAKDIILTILGILSSKGNVAKILEYGGSGVESLSIPERATIANMGAECGVTTSIFPSDEMTRGFLKAQGREKYWVPISSDQDAEYDHFIKINLDEVVPMVALPHRPDNIQTVTDVAGLKLDQVCIGSCTNSSYSDLMLLSHVLKTGPIYPGLDLVVASGSSQILRMLSANNGLESILGAGIRLQECVCGFCVGNSQSPRTEGVSLRTNNRNFMGRSGTKTSYVYLCSPETAAVSALSGELTDPRHAGIQYPVIQIPRTFSVDDSHFIFPGKSDDEVEIYRGPHMGSLPVGNTFPDYIIGEVAIKVGNDISTDHIITAGDRMKYRSNVAKYAEFLFERVDKDFYNRAVSICERAKQNIIVAGKSYGQGSSREHAALCLTSIEAKCVLAKSFERIHRSNLMNFGVAPLIFINEEDYEGIEQGDELEFSNIRNMLERDKPVFILNKTKNKEFAVSLSATHREKEILLAGGKLPFLKNKY